MRSLWIFFYYTALLFFEKMNLGSLITSTLPFIFKNIYSWKFWLIIDTWLFFIERRKLNDFLRIVLLRCFWFCIWRRLLFRCGNIFINWRRLFFLFSLEIEFWFSYCLWDPCLRIHTKLKNLATLRMINMLKRIWKLYLLWNTILFIIIYLFLWIQLRLLLKI